MSSFWRKNNGLNQYAEEIFHILQNKLTHVAEAFVDDKFPAIKNGFMAWRPHVDLTETDKEFILKADIPGVERKDLVVQLLHDLLIIKGERKVEHKKDTDSHHWTERFHGKFERSFNIPNNVVDQQKIDAKFADGVLTVTLKKKPETAKNKKNAKNIDIK